ncbi:MAG: hypothetical protein WB505_18045, partial [Pseudolabrys sp.]
MAEHSRPLTPQSVSTFHETVYRLGSSSSPQRNTTPNIALSSVGRSKLRMPIFAYFFVVGSVLTGLLLWFGNGSEPIGPAHTSSQTVGIPKFKPEPEPEHARATAVNFAAEYGRSERKSVKTAETPSRQKATANYSRPRSHFAEFPRDNLSI